MMLWANNGQGFPVCFIRAFTAASPVNSTGQYKKINVAKTLEIFEGNSSIRAQNSLPVKEKNPVYLSFVISL
jgi:hypothetical protein